MCRSYVLLHGYTTAGSALQVGAAPFAANWNGFFDAESAITGYEWALGSAAGLADIHPFTAVGLATTVRSTKTLSELAPGRASFYIAVRATNGHGRTTVAASPVVGVDATPPVGFACAADTANLLGTNGGFEAGIRCDVDAGPCWSLPVGDNSAATGMVGVPDAPAFEGSAFLALQGSLSATVGGLVVGDEYRLTLHARNLGGALHDTVVVGITGQQDTAFPVRVRPGAGAWQRFSVALRATANKVCSVPATLAE